MSKEKYIAHFHGGPMDEKIKEMSKQQWKDQIIAYAIDDKETMIDAKEIANQDKRMVITPDKVIYEPIMVYWEHGCGYRWVDNVGGRCPRCYMSLRKHTMHLIYIVKEVIEDGHKRSRDINTYCKRKYRLVEEDDIRIQDVLTKVRHRRPGEDGALGGF